MASSSNVAPEREQNATTVEGRVVNSSGDLQSSEDTHNINNNNSNDSSMLNNNNNLPVGPSTLTQQQWALALQQQQRLTSAQQNLALAQRTYQQLRHQREALDQEFNSDNPLADDEYDRRRKTLATSLDQATQVMMLSAKEEKDAAEQLIHLGLAHNLAAAQQQHRQQQQTTYR